MLVVGDVRGLGHLLVWFQAPELVGLCADASGRVHVEGDAAAAADVECAAGVWVSHEPVDGGINKERDTVRGVPPVVAGFELLPQLAGRSLNGVLLRGGGHGISG